MDLRNSLRGKTSSVGKIDFYEHICKVEEGAEKDWLKGIDKNGMAHSNNLEENMNLFIPDAFKKKLKPAEVFILLYAVYLHDIGYRNEKNGKIESEGHPSRSRDYILKNPDKYLLGEFRPPSMDNKAVPKAAEAVAQVCFGHAHEDVCQLNKDIENDFRDDFLCRGQSLNIRRLAALLRLADETDQAYTRLGRKNINSVEIGTGVVTWYWNWKGDPSVWKTLDEERRKVNEVLEPSNECLANWDGFKRTTVILHPEGPVQKPSTASREPVDYKAALHELCEHYIEPGCHDERGEDRGPLREFVKAWLKDPKRKLLAVLGDYGIGKTSFCYKFAVDLAGSEYSPVVVRLKDVKEKGWREAIQQETDSRAPANIEKVVLILDGFDELSNDFDKDTVRQEIEKLSEATGQYEKVILTSRTQFFRSPEEEKETLVWPVRWLYRVAKPLIYPRFERIYISPFNDSQMKEYLRLYLGDQRAQEFWSQTIEKVFDMKDLVRRPILIYHIVKDTEAFENIEGTVTPGRLYSVITERWRQREEERLPQSIEVQQEGETIPKNIRLFMEELAYWMFTKGKDRLHFNTLRDAIDRYFDVETKKDLRRSLDNLDYQIRNCTFLSRSPAEGYYAFAHRSFMEYFLATKLSREIPKNKAEEIKITDATALFVSELIDPSVYERIDPPQGVKVPEKMVYIPPGQFIMGQGDSIRIVTLEKGFFMDKYPVTNAQFYIFLNELGNQREGNVEWIDLKGSFEKERCRIRKDGGGFVVEPGFEEHPVIFVNWYGARAYAAWAGKRLPTKEEWEKAARGIDGRVYPWGNEFDKPKCNTMESGIGHTTPMGKYPAGCSPHGCLDMAGNVREWTDSWYDEKKEAKVLRGGPGARDQGYARCADRFGGNPESGADGDGFRCARTEK